MVNEASKSIPIVMASSQDAIGDGLVQSLAHPGGNVTGRSVYAPELTLKRIELLKDTLPNLDGVGVLRTLPNAGGLRQLREAEKAGTALGIAITPLDTHPRRSGECDGSRRSGRCGRSPHHLRQFDDQFAINLSTARALAIDIPPALLARVNEIIE
jgi:putative ABC transport system substrate-binding protein